MRCEKIKKTKKCIIEYVCYYQTYIHIQCLVHSIFVCFYSHVLQLIIKVQFRCRFLIWRINFSITYITTTIRFISFYKEFAEKGGIRWKSIHCWYRFCPFKQTSIFPVKKETYGNFSPFSDAKQNRKMNIKNNLRLLQIVLRILRQKSFKEKLCSFGFAEGVMF